jgi:formylglycine-generating enzyme required for sulfatase activity
MSPVLPLPQQLNVALSTNDRVGGINNVRHPVAVSPKTNSYRSLSALCTRSSSARLAARLSELRVAAIARWLLGGAVALGGIVIVFANLLTQNRPNQFDQPAQTDVDAFANTSKTAPFKNTLGMAFVPAGTPGVLFSVWETRVKDFDAFVEATDHNAIIDSNFGSPAATLEKMADGRAGWEQKGGSWRDPRFSTKQTGEHPVVCVSYLDAEAFCAWLTKRERAAGAIPQTASYRLPTDSEWSRAVGGSEFPWGDHFPPKSSDGNYAGQEAMVEEWQGLTNDLVKAGFRDSAARTAPVGRFNENRFGLYDMGGNVFEWCCTWYSADLNDAESKKAFPTLADDEGGLTYRVLRGAPWYVSGRVFLRSASRGRVVPRDRGDSIGFRVVLVVAGG